MMMTIERREQERESSRDGPGRASKESAIRSRYGTYAADLFVESDRERDPSSSRSSLSLSLSPLGPTVACSPVRLAQAETARHLALAGLPPHQLNQAHWSQGVKNRLPFPSPHLATRSQPKMDYRFINHDELVDIIRTKTAGQDYQIVDVRGTVGGGRHLLSLTGLPLTRQALSR